MKHNLYWENRAFRINDVALDQTVATSDCDCMFECFLNKSIRSQGKLKWHWCDHICSTHYQEENITHFKICVWKELSKNLITGCHGRPWYPSNLLKLLQAWSCTVQTSGLRQPAWVWALRRLGQEVRRGRKAWWKRTREDKCIGRVERHIYNLWSNNCKDIELCLLHYVIFL